MFPVRRQIRADGRGSGERKAPPLWSSGDTMAVRASISQSAWGQPVSATPRRLLIVEDDDDFAESLINVLRSRGYELRHVADATALWATLDGFTAEVALVDVRLGRHSGLELVAEMKERRPAMLNVVMTAYVAADSAIEALRTGAYDYLTKPFAPNELLATLDRCYERIELERARAEAEAARERSEARLRALIENALDLVAISSPGGDLKFLSPSVVSLLGYARDERTARNLLHLVHPEDRARAAAVLEACAAADADAGSTKTVEVRVRHKDGSWRWFET